MNGLMINYDKYLESLTEMKEPEVPKAKLDMRGAIEYANSKGIPVEDLTPEEKEKFIQYI